MPRTRAAKRLGLAAPLAAALAALLVAAAACTPGLGTEGTRATGGPGGPPRSAQAGRYSGLPEPCGAVNGDTVRELLPGAAEEEYAGEPMTTYDTGRRVGCTWHTAAATGTHRLSVDYLRVVSYDPEVSDDDRAEALFEERAADAGVPLAEGAEDGTGDGTDEGAEETAGSGAEGGAEGGVSPSDDPVRPRALDGIGHAAFVAEELTSTDPGERREVVLAFRNANVMVTVTYTVSTTAAEPPLDSTLLQQRARTVAGQLAGGFDG
ncbi:DUF3558 domain-containing protein [Streptomyces sp. DSM 44917]|uniref:DUF3558 domain-containing protein n=1 Tax=Streptomyces boetiae TaxID=3075541 RepID=A0ABU2LDR6_9ACTN|nr:DUF3558 domain-containing protein [Streptomyces sp. DSM 44917]MDT0309630.1 DUF3558 domain-containing protein [Streptomyces sp. DSM 44917]